MSILRISEFKVLMRKNNSKQTFSINWSMSRAFLEQLRGMLSQPVSPYLIFTLSNEKVFTGKITSVCFEHNGIAYFPYSIWIEFSPLKKEQFEEYNRLIEELVVISPLNYKDLEIRGSYSLWGFEGIILSCEKEDEEDMINLGIAYLTLVR